MNTTVRAVLATAALAPAVLLAPGVAAADPIETAAVHPVVLIGQQHQDPIAALLACSPVGLIPVFGPNIIFPICLV